MKIIIKEEGKPIEVLNMTDSIGGGTGEALGTAYKLADGRVITCQKTLRSTVHLRIPLFPLRHPLQINF